MITEITSYCFIATFNSFPGNNYFFLTFRLDFCRALNFIILLQITYYFYIENGIIRITGTNVSNIMESHDINQYCL